MAPLKARVLSLWTLASYITVMVECQTVPSYPGNECHPLPQSAKLSESSASQKSEEIQNLIKLLDWPEPLNPTPFMSSTSPETTECSLLDPRNKYQVGDRVKVFIKARDHLGHPKTYGGDYFQAKLHSPDLKAGVTGSITDHRNGSYTAEFLLPWPGVCQIYISLVHSSEAIALLKEKRDAHTFDVNYYGYFYQNGCKVRTVCNVRPSGQDVCNYRDLHTGEEWYCERPEGFPCSAYLEHAAGHRFTNYTAVEEEFLQGSVTDQIISSLLPSITVLPQEKAEDDRGTCGPGLSNPDPSGFYYQDKWHSRVCRNQEFPSPDNITSCLKGKIVYMFGDSTLRQCWEHLAKFVPSLQVMDLHVTHDPGPLLATDAEHGYLVQWRAHQKPLFMDATRVQELRFIANELDNIGGQQDGLIIVINCAAHFITFPVKYYLKRITGIRDAVARLLERSPQTKVIIKSANTGFLPPTGSDWLTWQLDTLMRAVFLGLPVSILDAWQMTSCHYLPIDVHPNHIVVQNVVDLILSYICPI